MRFDYFAGRNFAVRGFCGEGVIKADLPEGGFAKKTDPAKRDQFCRESLIRSGRAVWFLIEGWCDEGTELEHAAENGVKRDEVGRGSRLYGADIAKKETAGLF